MYRSHHNLRAFFAPSSQGDLVVRRRRADDTSYYIDRGLAYRIEMPDDGLRSKYNLWDKAVHRNLATVGHSDC
ncbi:hypothetical protein RI054_14g67850 [Pseudoscourfieldia marina]